MTDPHPGADQAGESRSARGRRLRSWPVAIALTQAALVIGLGAWLLDGRPIGVPGAWAWEVRAKAVPWLALTRVLALSLGLMCVGGLGLQRIRARCRSDALVLAALVALAFALQLAVLGLASDASFLLIAATASPVSTEYFSTAWGVSDLGEFVGSYPLEMTRGHHHVATHPPGAVIFYWLCIRAYESPLFPHSAFDRLVEIVVGAPRDGIAAGVNAFPGVSLELEGVGPALLCCLVLGACGALSLVPLFLLARAAAGRSTALTVCTLFALSPAPVLFFQGLDSLLLLLALAGMALMLRALQGGKLLPAGVAGLVIGAGFLVSFGAMAAGLLTGSLAVLCALRGGRRHAWLSVAAFTGGVALVILVGHVACGMKLHVILRQGMAAHREFTWVGFRRDYPTWLVLNVVEFACFLGLPLCIAVIGAGREAVRRGWRGLSQADLVGLAGVLVLLLLNLSGSVRGEVGRVWLFMMPPLVLWAGHWLSSAAPGKRALVLVTAVLTVLQLALLGPALTPVVMPF